MGSVVQVMEEHFGKLEERIEGYFKRGSNDENHVFIKGNSELFDFFNNIRMRKLEHLSSATTDSAPHPFQINLSDSKQELSKISSIKQQIRQHASKLLFFNFKTNHQSLS